MDALTAAEEKPKGKGQSVVIAGDTRPNENVVRYETGVDVLVHKVAAVNPELAKVPAVAAIMAHHTTAPDAGRIFTRAHSRYATSAMATVMTCA